MTDPTPTPLAYDLEAERLDGVAKYARKQEKLVGAAIAPYWRDVAEWAEQEAARRRAALLPPQPDGRAEVEARLVAAYAPAMLAKLDKARAKGRGGWEKPEECTVTHLWDCLNEHVRKPNLDMVDVGNIAAMIWHRLEHVPGDREALAAHVAAHALTDGLRARVEALRDELLQEADGQAAQADNAGRGRQGDQHDARARSLFGAADRLTAVLAEHGPTPLPPLKPLFKRLAAVHPWWTDRVGPCYDGLSEWALDDATIRDVDWMAAHLRLYRALINTVAGLGWSYRYEYPSLSARTPAISPRWHEIRRGSGIDINKWRPHGEPHRATGPTDLHALLEALVLALEAEVAEGREIVVDAAWKRHDMEGRA